MAEGENMTRRALVIGSETPPLQGVHNDCAAIATVLQGRDFEVETRIQGNATRAGILDGIDALIRRTGDSDAAVIYYSGHGAYAFNAEARPGERERYQSLCPTDWDRNARDDFGGILDVELALKLRAITDKTPNVVVILDCCYAAEMWRSFDTTFVERAFNKPWAAGVSDFLARIKPDTSRLATEGNARAVRIVATDADRRALESDVSIGGYLVRRGLLTHALEQVLLEVGNAPVSWRTVSARVRELVLAIAPDQRPDVEGPSDRMLFTATNLDRPDAVVYFERKGESFLRANRILGATVGARYSIMRNGAAGYDSTAVVATAEVVALVGASAHVKLENVTQGGPQPGAAAYPERLPYPPLPIKLAGLSPEQLHELVRNTRLEVVVDGEPPRFTVRADRGKLAVLEGDREAMLPLTDDAKGRETLRAWLERWSKAEAVRNLEGEGLPPDSIGVTWGRVEKGVQIEHAPGEQAHVGDWIYVVVTNRTTQPLYIAIFDIGLGGKVTLLTSGSPGGRKLEPGKSTTLGKRDGEPTVRGIGPVTWAKDVPEDGRRRESLVVVATTDWTEFPLLETPVVTRALANRLETVLETFREARYREMPDEGPAGAGQFCVRRIDFELEPTPRAGFVIDRSVDPNDLVRTTTAVARGLQPLASPRSVALRIREIALHRNGALWGSAKVRIDTLALTGAASEHAYHAKTEVFRAEKNQILPLTDLLVFEGPVERFLDFGIWVGRDEDEIAMLQSLLDDAAQKGDLKSAVATLSGLAVAAPHAAALAAAGIAVGRIVSFASKLLIATVGTSIGLYRQSFLPHEQFGTGRHPREGVIRANDFSFAFEVIDTSS
jgi:hypothetical protein